MNTNLTNMQKVFALLAAMLGLTLSCLNAAAQNVTNEYTLTYDGLGIGNDDPIPDPYPAITGATVIHAGLDNQAANFQDVTFWGGVSPGNGYGNLTNVAVGPPGTPSSSPAWETTTITPSEPSVSVRLISFDVASKDDNDLDENNVQFYVTGPPPGGTLYWQSNVAAVAGDVDNTTHTHIAFGGTAITAAPGQGLTLWCEARNGRVAVDNVKFELIGSVGSAKNDFYTVRQGETLTVPAPGVLSNDSVSPGVGQFTAAVTTGPVQGVLILTNNGGFAYTSTNATGMDGFIYQAHDDATNSRAAVALISVLPAGALFYDDFARPGGVAVFTPWKVKQGNWSVSNGVAGATGSAPQSHAYAFITNTWTDCSVQVQARFRETVFSPPFDPNVEHLTWNVCGRLDPITGARYELNLLYEPTQWTILLGKNLGWSGGFSALRSWPVGNPGSTSHSLKLTFQRNRILAFYDGVLMGEVTDNSYSSGGIVLGMFRDTTPHELSFEDVIVRQVPIATNLAVQTAEEVSTNLVLQGSIGEGTKTFAVASGPTNGSLGVLNATSGLVTYTPAANYSGPDAFTFTVSDGTLYSTGLVSITVASPAPALNHAPIVANPIPNQSATYGTAFNFQFAVSTFTDGDGNTLTYNASGMPPGIGFGGVRTFSGTPTATGTFPVEVVATDNGIPNLSVTNTFDLVVAQRAITVTAGTDSKTYDRTTRSAGVPTITTGSLAAGNTATWTQTFDNENVGTGKMLTPAGSVNDGNGGLNYNVTFANNTTGVITPAPLTIAGVTADKVYDGNTTAALAGDAQLNGVLGGELVTLTSRVYDNSTNDLLSRFDLRGLEIGDEISLAGPVNRVSGFSFEYWAEGPGASTGNVQVILRFYKNDGDVLPGIIPETHLPGSLLFKSKPFPISATDRSVLVYTEQGDFTNALAADVLLTKPLPSSFTWTVEFTGLGTGDSAGLDVYSPPVIGNSYPDYWEFDGMEWALLTHFAAPPIDFAAKLEAAATGTFADKNAANGKTVTINGLALSGANAANYTLTPTITANILPKPLTITGLSAVSKVYDGNTTATLSGAVTLVGVVTPDVVTVDGTVAGAVFASKNVGTHGVTVSGYALGGTDKDNYSLLAQPTSADASITAKAVTPVIVANDKIYDGTSAATLSSQSVTGTVGAEVVTLGVSAASFNTEDSGIGKTVTATGLTLGGADAGNYVLGAATATDTADITAKAVTVMANNRAKTYGDTVSFIGTEFSTSGFVNGDGVTTVTLTSDGAPAIATVGNYAIVPSAAQGAGLANYAISYNNGALMVSKAILTATADDKSRAYGESNPVFTISYAGFVNGDDSGDVDSLPVAGTTATTTSAPGDYDITLTGGADNNYTFNLASGTLTITDAVSPEIISIRVTDGVAVITWNAIGGREYKLQYKDNVTDAAWVEALATVLAKAPTASTENFVGNLPRRFYRVKLMPIP